MTPSVAYDPDAHTPVSPPCLWQAVVDGVPSHVNLAHRGEGAREPRSSCSRDHYAVSSVR
jgi:hypothetical protein